MHTDNTDHTADFDPTGFFDSFTDSLSDSFSGTSGSSPFDPFDPLAGSGLFDEADRYRWRLWEDCLDAVRDAASRGWRPGDLLHLCGPRVGHLCFIAAGNLGVEVPWPMRELWLREVEPVAEPKLCVPALEDLRLALTRTQVHLGAAPTAPSGGRLSPAAEKIARRVRALLDKAASTNYPAEAESLTAAAHRLRRRHLIDSIDEAGAGGAGGSGSGGSGGADGEVAEARVYLDSPWVRHQFLLLVNVAAACSCRCVLVHRCGIVAVFGAPDDLDHVVDLFASLNRQRAHFMTTGPGARAAAARRATSAYRRSFQVSYARHIGELLAGAEKQVTVEATVDGRDTAAALPVLADRARRAEDACSEAFPQTSTMSLSARDSAGYLDGWRAAERSRLGGDSAGVHGPHALPGGVSDGTPGAAPGGSSGSPRAA
ncbi:DUF2786 domain-containing protein [Corynebacterium frankenforstense]|uniref:DUF2786 domain-containing protein n=1 Tax=Corynebacterium frankenforstense TaxID=1230998 RepID=UPI0026F2C977|nr:DUF2786 domain-containing protein [Corynebacterium frankenforstense]